MISDLVLYISYAIVNDPTISEMVDDFTHGNAFRYKRIEVPDLNLEQRSEIAAVLKTLKDLPKMAITLLYDSALIDYLWEIQFFPHLELEVCSHQFSQRLDTWGSHGKMVKIGDLTPFPRVR
jgi:hypothetical protein